MQYMQNNAKSLKIYMIYSKRGRKANWRAHGESGKEVKKKVKKKFPNEINQRRWRHSPKI